jgi:cytochrome P450
VNGPTLIEDIRKASPRQLAQAALEPLQLKYTLGPEMEANPYHIPVIKSPLTQSLTKLYPDVRDEIVAAFNDCIALDGSEWKAVPALDSVMTVVCRANNRFLVGFPLCRNADYLALNLKFAVDVVMTGALINVFPAFLRPLVAKLCRSVPASVQGAMKHLKPIIDERRRDLPEDRPDDLLSWLMAAAPEGETALHLTRRVMAMNFAGIHTSSMSFTSALFRLASQPDVADKLCKEIELVVEEDGWTKDALLRMPLLDSFLKESARVEPIACLIGIRKTREDFPLSDGTVVPAGTFLSVGLAATHGDDALYPNARDFDAFRFVGEEGAPANRMATVNNDYLTFGMGRHTCPGRFVAATELKAMLAHVVTTYDVKLEEGHAPVDKWYGISHVPDPKAKVMFRKRAARP